MKTQVEFAQQDFDVFSKFKSTDIPAHKKYINRIEWNPIGNRLISSSETFLKLWNYDDIGGLVKVSDLKVNHEGSIDSIKWRDANTVLTVSKESFKIWDTRDNKSVKSEKNDKKSNIQGAWIPDGDIFGVSLKENIINFYDRRTNGIVENIKYQHEIGNFCWDNSASALLVSTWENSVGNIQMRESKPGYPLHQSFPCHSAKITAFQIDQSGEFLVTGSEDATVNLYNLQEMICIRSYYKTDGIINSLSFSPNSKYLLVSSEQSYFDIYNIETGKHSFRKDNETGLGYSQVKWHPKKDVFALVEEEDKSKRNEQGKIRILNRRFDKSVQ